MQIRRRKSQMFRRRASSQKTESASGVKLDVVHGVTCINRKKPKMRGEPQISYASAYRRMGVSANAEIVGEASRTTFGGRVEGWKSAFFQSSILPSFHLADTPTRRHADTASFVVAAPPRYGICGFKFGI